MSLQFYMDEHVHSGITDGLRLRGVDVSTVQEDGREGIFDPEMLDRATALGRVLFTQDEDFLAESAQRQRQGIPFAGVIYAHQLRVSIGQCVQDLELMAGVYEPEEMASQLQFVPIR